jgi:transposase-like protein
MELKVESHGRAARIGSLANAYRDPTWETRAGGAARKGSHFPGVLEARRLVEKALAAGEQETYVHDVSTRSVNVLVKAMGMRGSS